jgi:glycosyltransferase involved in cell wall biosynthesis
MLERPRVSVCIPVRNGARELPFTLANLFDHTAYPSDRFEVIVVDHGSTDDTAAVAARWPAKVVSAPYTAPVRSAPRNRALEVATGDIVIFIDHDVLVPPDFIAAHVDIHGAHDHALVAGMTFGKAFLEQPLAHLLDRLDLNNIGPSLPMLREAGELVDARRAYGMTGEDVVDVTQQLVAYRYFWTCNLSARRTDITRVGSFDEGYVGWGVEDDDFAFRFREAGCALLFAPSAWGFHVPHPTSMWGNVFAWRRNFERMFRKFATRELEYFATFGHEVAAGTRMMEGILARLRARAPGAPAEAVTAALGKPTGRRLSYFGDAHGATDALDPYMPLTSRPRDGVWPLMGLRLPFGTGAIDEAIIDLDRWIVLDHTTLRGMLAEAIRVAREVILYAGPRTRDPVFATAVADLCEALSVFDLGRVRAIVGDRRVPLDRTNLASVMMG